MADGMNGNINDYRIFIVADLLHNAQHYTQNMTCGKIKNRKAYLYGTRIQEVTRCKQQQMAACEQMTPERFQYQV